MSIVPTVDIVDRPRAMGYDGYIDNVLIRLAVTPQTPWRDVTAEATPPRIDTAEAAEDVKDEVGQRYSRSNLSGGAGLDFLHERNRPDDAGIRFWDSKGVDVFHSDPGSYYEAPLLHRIDADGGGYTDIESVCAVDGVVYFARAAGIYTTASQQAALTGITKMIAMGNSLYTLDGVNGVRQYPVSTFTPSSVSATAFDEIWAIKSRIVGATANQLYDTSDESTPILSLPPGEYPTQVIDAGPAVLVFGSDGYIYALTLDQDLALVSAGQTRFVDEVPLMAVESFGVIGLVTAESTEAGGKVTRFYTGQLGLSGSYALEGLQLQYQVGDRTTTEDLTAHSILATRDSIYVAVPEEGTTEFTLWRYYLPTGGYARSHTVDPGAGSHTVESFIQIDDRFYLAINGDDLWIETDEYVSVGYVIGPLADFFTAEPKQWVGADLAGSVNASGAFLELYDTTDPDIIEDPDSTSWRHVFSLGNGESTKSTAVLSGRSARWHAAKVVWRSASDRLLSPRFRSFVFRALPAPERDVLVEVPLNVSDQIESRGRRATRIPGRGKAIEDALRAYEGKHVLIEFYRPELEIRGLIEKFEETIQTVSNQGSVGSVMYARIRGTRIKESVGYSAEPTDGVSFGEDRFGWAPFAIGDQEA